MPCPHGTPPRIRPERGGAGAGCARGLLASGRWLRRAARRAITISRRRGPVRRGLRRVRAAVLLQVREQPARVQEVEGAAAAAAGGARRARRRARRTSLQTCRPPCRPGTPARRSGQCRSAGRRPKNRQRRGHAARLQVLRDQGLRGAVRQHDHDVQRQHIVAVVRAQVALELLLQHALQRAAALAVLVYLRGHRCGAWGACRSSGACCSRLPLGSLRRREAPSGPSRAWKSAESSSASCCQQRRLPGEVPQFCSQCSAVRETRRWDNACGVHARAGGRPRRAMSGAGGRPWQLLADRRASHAAAGSSSWTGARPCARSQAMRAAAGRVRAAIAAPGGREPARARAGGPLLDRRRGDGRACRSGRRQAGEARPRRARPAPQAGLVQSSLQPMDLFAFLQPLASRFSVSEVHSALHGFALHRPAPDAARRAGRRRAARAGVRCDGV